MKRLTLFVLISITPMVVNAQLIVEDPANYALNKTHIAKTLEQIEKVSKQITLAKNQLSYTKRTFQRQVEAMRNLKDRNWNNVEDINDNIDRIDAAVRRVYYMDKYAEQRYRYLYREFERLDKMTGGNVDKALKDIENDRDQHVEESADKVIGVSSESQQGASNANEYLDEVEEAMQQDSLSAQQQRQINAQLLATINQQMIQLQQVVSAYAEFAAKQQRMAQNQEEDEAVADSIRHEKAKDQFQRWKDSHKGNEHGIILGSENN